MAKTGSELSLGPESGFILWLQPEQSLGLRLGLDCRKMEQLPVTCIGTCHEDADGHVCQDMVTYIWTCHHGGIGSHPGTMTKNPNTPACLPQPSKAYPFLIHVMFTQPCEVSSSTEASLPDQWVAEKAK